MNPNKLIVSVYSRAFPGNEALYRNPDIVRNEQGVARAFPRNDVPQRRPVALVQENRIRLATWNVGMLTDEYKLWYTGKDNNRNGGGIIVDKDLKDKVVNVSRIGDRLLLIKLVLGEEIINIISAYAPQVGLDDRIKIQFWEDIDGIMVIVNTSFLDFVMAYDLAIVNTYFKKQDKQLITYKSETHKSQIDLFLVKKVDRPSCKDYNVILGEILTTQHRLVAIDVLEFKK
ncbi:hypothetical protein AMTRI_Chr10g226480 [Amborella trichopoda]